MFTTNRTLYLRNYRGGGEGRGSALGKGRAILFLDTQKGYCWCWVGVVRAEADRWPMGARRGTVEGCSLRYGANRQSPPRARGRGVAPLPNANAMMAGRSKVGVGEAGRPASWESEHEPPLALGTLLSPSSSAACRCSPWQCKAKQSTRGQSSTPRRLFALTQWVCMHGDISMVPVPILSCFFSLFASVVCSCRPPPLPEERQCLALASTVTTSAPRSQVLKSHSTDSKQTCGRPARVRGATAATRQWLPPSVAGDRGGGEEAPTAAACCSPALSRPFQPMKEGRCFPAPTSTKSMLP